MRPFADLGLAPVYSGVTYEQRSEATASPAGRLRLWYCPECCHVYNVAFDPDAIAYDADYDNSLDCSHTFTSYADGLAHELASAYSLEGKEVVELGCGKGVFLTQLCRAANCHGTGYDRSYDGSQSDPHVRFVDDYMPWHGAQEFDFFVSRHVVEHLEDPYDFLSGLRRACGSRRVYGYIEVPDAIYDFERSPWNCHYPHVSYFSATSLARLALRAGFVLQRAVRRFDGQYLGFELGAAVDIPDRPVFGGAGLDREHQVLAEFQHKAGSTIEGWRARLQATGFEHCALWGAGAKGLAFLNAVDPEGRMGAVVDLNPGKWGRYLPVTGHRVISPDELATRPVDTVLITNPSYQDEIERDVAALGMRASVVCAH